MRSHVSRLSLALSGLIMLAGALMHAAAYGRTDAAVSASNLSSFFAGSLRALWLIDSTALFTLGVVFAAVAARPQLASRPVVILLAAIPAATALLLYKFIGSTFAPAHMLLAAALLGLLGAGVRADGRTRA